MKILLDTHYLLWALGDINIKDSVRDLIIDPANEVYFSVISIWEIVIKHQIHPDKMPFEGKEVIEMAKETGFRMLGLKEDHVFGYDDLSLKEGCREHRDPFDRILISQAKHEKMRFLTRDRRLDVFNEKCVMLM